MYKKISLAMLVFMVVSFYLLSIKPIAASSDNKKADLVLKNGFIYTVRSEAEALAIKGDKIVYVGDDVGVAEWVDEKTQVIDLKGKMVLPGFIDSHIHAIDAVDDLYLLSLSGIYNLDEYQKAIQEYYKQKPDLKVLLGTGWDNTAFPAEGPTKESIDEIVNDIPVILFSIDDHSIWVNSKALEMAGVSGDTPDPDGGIIERDKDGNPSGTLRENAMDLVENILPEYTINQYIEGIKYFQSLAHSYGITTVLIPGLEVGSDPLKALSQLDKEKELTLRIRTALALKPDDDITIMPTLVKVREQEKGGLFEVTSVKFFMDGVVDGGTAYLEEPYENKPDYRGELLWKPEYFNKFCAALEKAGFQIHVHSIGDASTSVTLDGLAYANKTMPDARPIITHLQLVKPEDIKRFAELGVIASTQPFWFVVDGTFEQAIEYLGKERAEHQYPMQSFFDKDVVVASSSDYTVTVHPRPLIAIEQGVTRAYVGETGDESVLPQESERATLEEMIASYTINGAYANFLEKETGSLEVGKKADIVVLDKNLFNLKPNQISTAKEMLVFFEGKEVFRDKSYK